MHDGSIATRSEVIDHYARGGRARHRLTTDPLLAGFMLTEAERAELLAFLASLTDQQFIHDPRHADPWPREQSLGAAPTDLPAPIRQSYEGHQHD
jgi:cytochrome c peroxidase